MNYKKLSQIADTRTNYDKWLTAWLNSYSTADSWYEKLSTEEKAQADKEIMNAAEEAKHATEDCWD